MSLSYKNKFNQNLTIMQLSKGNHYYIISLFGGREEEKIKTIKESAKRQGINELNLQIFKDLNGNTVLKGYLLLAISPELTEKQIKEILKVISKKTNTRNFLKVPANGIQSLLESLNSGEIEGKQELREEKKLKQTGALKKGESVRLKKGSFINYTGRIIEIYADKNEVDVDIFFGGRFIPIRRPESDCERI